MYGSSREESPAWGMDTKVHWKLSRIHSPRFNRRGIECPSALFLAENRNPEPTDPTRRDPRAPIEQGTSLSIGI